MIRKSIRRALPGIRKAKHRLAHIQTTSFTGWAAWYHILEAERPFVVQEHDPTHLVTLADAGYTWLTLLPDDAFLGIRNIAVTGLYTPSALLEVYVDMIAGKGVDPDGIPWFDDLYLDVALRPQTGQVVTLDRDELDEALRRNDITANEHAIAMETGALVAESLRTDPHAWLALLHSISEL